MEVTLSFIFILFVNLSDLFLNKFYLIFEKIRFFFKNSFVPPYNFKAQAKKKNKGLFDQVKTKQKN